jgi:hypothetical protein
MEADVTLASKWNRIRPCRCAIGAMLWCATESMNKALLSVLLGSLALRSAAGADDYFPFRIRIPADADAARALVLVGEYGHGLSIVRVDRKAGSNEFIRGIAPRTTSAKLLIYYPGCRLLTAEMPREQLLQPFTAVFHKLPAVPLTLQLTRSDGTAMPGQSVSLRQPLLEMEYFGYGDGIVSWTGASPVASGTTDASGRVSLAVPLLLDDPLFAGLKVEPGFHLSLGGDRPFGPRDYDLVPAWLPAQRSYASPVVVKFLYRGSISGKVERSFLLSHGADVPLGPYTNKECRVSFYVHEVGSRGSSGTGLKADGSFSVPLRAGTYDFTIEVNEGAKSPTPRRLIPVGTNVVIGEREHRQLILK